MNIFEIFCAGDGRINEPNMSSALHFLLEPKSPHGLGLSSLAEFLAPISAELALLCSQGHLPNRVRAFDVRKFMGSFDRIEMTLEETVFNPVNGAAQRSRAIDLTIRCFNGDVAPALVIALENKISAGSASDPRQLADEYAFLRAKLDADYPQEQGNGARIPIIFVYLTPETPSGASQAQWDALDLPAAPQAQHADFKVNYTWKPLIAHAVPAKSITTIAKSLLRKEQDGDISPASSHASLFLRSMIKFIDNDFTNESFDAELTEPVDNAREILTEEEFWAGWQAIKAGSLAFARHLFNLVDADFAAWAQARGIVDTGVVFTKTRIGFFKGTERPIAILLQNPTTNARIAIECKPGLDPVLMENLAAYTQQHRVDVRPKGANIELQIPIDMDHEALAQLLAMLVNQLP